jgi:DNA-binding transcriptional ArsR family regulator
MRILVRLSPQFDLCYALAELLAPEPLLPARPFGLDRKLPRWLKQARRFGWSFWMAVPDVLDDRPPARSIEEFLDGLAALPAGTMFERIRRGLFHTEPGEPQRPQKREWLHFVGVEGQDRLATQGTESDKAEVLAILRAFAERFETVWRAAESRLSASAKSAERLARSGDLPKVARALDLAVDGGEAGGRLRALRGGWSIATDDIGTAYLIPGLFNPRRLYNAADERRPVVLFFPFNAVPLAELGVAPATAEIDPWLVARAAGDPTRAAILRLLAVRPQTASDLLAELGLSKATISHHIFQLREAGLIDEERHGKSVRLSLRRATFAGLSDAFRKELGRD